MIKIVAIGKKHESWIFEGLERYEKRLKQPFDVQWELLPHSSLEGDKARQEESTRLLERLRDGDTVLLLDEMGAMIDSPALSTKLDGLFTSSKQPVFVIGGAYGVDERLRQRADETVSLSKMVFPHQLVRLLLVEQLYRAQEITRGSGYHHI